MDVPLAAHPMNTATYDTLLLIMTWLMVLLAAVMAAFNSLCMRRAIDVSGSSRIFLVVQLACAGAAVVVLDPVQQGAAAPDLPVLALGVVGGAVLAIMMWGLGKAFETGPAGLTSAGMNTASVFPAIAMALLFGSAWGHPYRLSHVLGSILVVIGLFWAGWEARTRASKRVWLSSLLVAFLGNIVLLCFLQWRVLLMRGPWDVSVLVPFQLRSETVGWMFPLMYLVATLIQLARLARQRFVPNIQAVIYGAVGGIASAASLLLLAAAPERATPLQNGMLFPVFAISTMILCNLWGQLLYRERVNWLANGICMGGLLIGTANWAFR